MAATATPATDLLARHGVPHTVHAYEVSVDTPDYGRAVADALGVSPERLLKTLVTDVDGELVVAVLPVSGGLDLKALARAVSGKKARLADRAAAEQATGYVRGGISPLGQRRRLRTVVDSSVTDHTTVYVNAGRIGFQVELPPDALVRLTDAVLAPILRRTGLDA